MSTDEFRHDEERRIDTKKNKKMDVLSSSFSFLAQFEIGEVPDLVV